MSLVATRVWDGGLVSPLVVYTCEDHWTQVPVGFESAVKGYCEADVHDLSVWVEEAPYDCKNRIDNVAGNLKIIKHDSPE